MRTSRQLAVTHGSLRTFEADANTFDPLAALLPAGERRYLQGAWSASDLEDIGVTDRVLLLGATLPALDAVLALDDRGHRGVVRLVSPRGLLLAARERLAPAVAKRVAALCAAGRLDVCAGSVRGAEAYGDTFVVDILPRGRTLHVSERYDWILNLHGPAQRRPWRVGRAVIAALRRRPG